MHIYFCGIGGNGLGPLAEIAGEAGHLISGSDMAPNAMTKELSKKGVRINYGQTGKEIAVTYHQRPIDWLVVSSAIPGEGHPEVEFAKKHKIKITKRGPLLSRIIKEKHLQLIAISGTHGKTTTTAMVVWILQQLKREPSYSVGTNLPFGPSGKYVPGSKYFVYEADEHDRNMLDFYPYLVLLPSLDYDHPNTYPTRDDYRLAFWELIKQSQWVYMWQDAMLYLGMQRAYNIYVMDDTELPKGVQINLAGELMRRNGLLAAQAVSDLLQVPLAKTIAAINRFPGTRRRFEKLADNVYTDYAHHPTEIRATLELANEVMQNIVVVYEPHQNIRQVAVADEYTDCFAQATHVLWLPTYLTRENPDLDVLTQVQLISKLANPEIAEPAQMNSDLYEKLKQYLSNNMTIIFMGAGPIDDWARKHFAPQTVSAREDEPQASDDSNKSDSQVLPTSPAETESSLANTISTPPAHEIVGNSPPSSTPNASPIDPSVPFKLGLAAATDFPDGPLPMQKPPAAPPANDSPAPPQ